MRRTLVIAALAVGLLAPQHSLAKRVCVEEVGGTCLKYQERPDASPAQIAERRLGLSLANRRRIQRGLQATGHYSGAIDGTFGRATRRAIRGWQRARGDAATGFLSARQADVLASAAPAPAAPPAGPASTFRDCAACPEMVTIPAGSFLMGAPESEAKRRDERPQHRVSIRTFALAATEVTFDEWQACVDGGGCSSNKRPDDKGWGRGGRPVINVSWDEVQEYLAWLNSRVSGAQYRLPTEAEWEYAARAGTTTPFAFGQTIATDQANYKGTGVFGPGRAGVDRRRTVEVTDLAAANPWGLRHMHGNVWEWTQDCWHHTYERAPADGSAWLSSDRGDCGERVIRGGSWDFTPIGVRSATRFSGPSDVRSDNLGFRPAKTLSGF